MVAKPCDAIYATKNYIFTGGRDNCICILDKKGKVLNKIDMEKLTEGKAIWPRIRSLCVSKDNKKLLVGTFGSEIYELTATE